MRLITGLAGLSQHFQLSCNVSTNVLHHSKPKSHCLLLSEVRKNVFYWNLHLRFSFFSIPKVWLRIFTQVKKIFFNFFHLNLPENLQVRPIAIDLCYKNVLGFIGNKLSVHCSSVWGEVYHVYFTVFFKNRKCSDLSFQGPEHFFFMKSKWLKPSACAIIAEHYLKLCWESEHFRF